MRPRGRGDDDDDDDEEVEYSPHRSPPEPEPEPEAALQQPPPPPARAPLSSLVVKPSRREGNGASSSPDAAAARSSPAPAGGAPGRHRGSSIPRRRLDLSPPDFRGRERRRSPPMARRRPPGSPPSQLRRLSPPPPRRRLTPPGFQPRHPRPYDEPQGYGMHAGLSPQRQRRPENRSSDDAFGPRYAHGYQGGGRGVARFRDGSPPYGRGGRSYRRGSGAPGKEFINIDGEYVHRNDPNLSPREGDWICQNPNCGNLNFARRTHCNNCNKYRFSREVCEPSHSPHRDYVNPPRGPPRNLGPSDRAPPREMTRYRSPLRGWGVSDPKGYPAQSPPDHAGRYADPLQRERMGFHGDRQLRDRVKHGWSSAEDYNPRERPHDDMYLERSQRRSVSPQDNWGHNRRDRSRSPAGSRLLKGSFTGGGRPDLEYADPYVGRGRPNNLDDVRCRGRGYIPGGGTYLGKGQGDRRAAPSSRNDGSY